MITMIVGVITVVGLLVTRMPNGNAMALPPDITLPQGKVAQAVTMGKGWVGVVTDDNHFLIYDSAGALVQDMPLSLPETAP